MMMIPTSPFSVIDWNLVEATRHPGEAGYALARTLTLGDVRIRRVDYSEGYLADHWCDIGHIAVVMDGELDMELKDGRTFNLGPGMSFHVSDFGDAPHRASSKTGAKVMVVD